MRVRFATAENLKEDSVSQNVWFEWSNAYLAEIWLVCDMDV